MSTPDIVFKRWVHFSFFKLKSEGWIKSEGRWLEIILFSIADLSHVAKSSNHAHVTAPPDDVFSKLYKSLDQGPFGSLYILDF